MENKHRSGLGNCDLELIPCCEGRYDIRRLTDTPTKIQNMKIFNYIYA